MIAAHIVGTGIDIIESDRVNVLNTIEKFHSKFSLRNPPLSVFNFAFDNTFVKRSCQTTKTTTAGLYLLEV